MKKDNRYNNKRLRYFTKNRFATLFEESPLSMQIFSPDGQTVKVNKAWEKLWNTTLDKLGSYNILKDKQLEEKGILKYIKRGFNGEALSIPAIKYEPPKTVAVPGVVLYRWTSAFIYPVKDGEGKIKEVVLIHQDITEQKVYEENLAESKKHLNELVSNVPGVVWEAYGKPNTNKQKIEFVSEYAKKLLGYPIREWFKKDNFWLNIVHPDDRKRAAKEAAAIFASGIGGISRFRWRKKNSEYIWVEAQSKVIKNARGNIIGMRGVTMDISERCDIEQRKDEFISMASHELKTPLTSISIYLKLINQNNVLKRYSNICHYLNLTNKQLERLTKLINGLLNVSLIKSEKLRLKKAFFSLEDLLKNKIENSRTQTKKSKIELIGKIKRQVWGDERYIDEVVDNLLSNALKYSPKGDKVVVKVKPRKEDVVVSVEDHGFGIEKKYQDKIFNRFYRVYDKRDKTFPGMGVGLYISKEIIVKHGGNMWLESEKGKGSKFFFTLPYKGAN